jgi:hypothetical protein
MFYVDPNVKVDMLACITLASCAQNIKYGYCYKQFKLSYLSKFGLPLITNFLEEDENENALVEEVVDDLNNFHMNFKKESFFPSLQSDHVNENNYYKVNMNWMKKKCDSYNYQDMKMGRKCKC